MILYADAGGRLLRVLKTEKEAEQYGAPDEYVEMLEIDVETNPLITLRIDTAWNDLRLSGGVLYYKGKLVTVNPPSTRYAVQADSADANLRTTEQIDVALADYEIALGNWDNLTQAQLKAVVRRNVEVLVQLLRYHLQEVL